ncbi:uncharacterized protein LOC128930368 [Callithrix jacchus]
MGQGLCLGGGPQVRPLVGGPQVRCRLRPAHLYKTFPGAARLQSNAYGGKLKKIPAPSLLGCCDWNRPGRPSASPNPAPKPDAPPPSRTSTFSPPLNPPPCIRPRLSAQPGPPSPRPRTYGPPPCPAHYPASMRQAPPSNVVRPAKAPPPYP